MESIANPDIAIGTIVRWSNYAGPCFKSEVIGIGRSRYKLDFHGSPHFIYFFEAHLEPCPGCTDHPKTMYPNGYDL